MVENEYLISIISIIKLLKNVLKNEINNFADDGDMKSVISAKHVVHKH